MTPNITFPYKLYLVISEADCKAHHFLDVAEQAILGGVDIIQLREKKVEEHLFYEKAKQLKQITDHYQIPLIINDSFNVAKKVNAHGIHVGNKDILPVQVKNKWTKEKLIGYSIEFIEQLKNKQTATANYLGVSPVFSTPTKTDTVTAWGISGIANIRRLTEKPLVAIGNMCVKNVKPVLNAGADCIAVVSAICGANNPEKAAYELKNELLK